MVFSARHIIVRGCVQGVGYRNSTRKEAQVLGLTGWVRNLPAGEVEMVVCGVAHAIDQLVFGLWKGPPAARVSAVEVTPLSLQEGYADFSIR